MDQQRSDRNPGYRTPGCLAVGWLVFLALALVGLFPAIGSVSTILEEARLCEETGNNPDTCQPFASVAAGLYLLGYGLLVLVPLLGLSVVQGLDPPSGKWKAASWITVGLILAFLGGAFIALSIG